MFEDAAMSSDAKWRLDDIEKTHRGCERCLKIIAKDRPIATVGRFLQPGSIYGV